MRADVVIRNGTIVDGTGAPRRGGDVAVADGRILAVGRFDGQAAAELDARGRVVAPGFLDIHTHYDAQLCWDGLATPSPLHGVTTVCTGNCSLSLAPVRGDGARRMVGMFQTIEDIREQTFAAAVPFAWETFPEYLAFLTGRLGVNVIPLVGHSALRLYVMGEDSQRRTASDAELARMCELLGEAVAAGARGISTSYLDVDEDLRPVPSRLADLRERVALARAARAAGGGVMQTVPDLSTEGGLEVCLDELGRISRETGIACTLQPVIYFPRTPDLWKRALDGLERENRTGAVIYGQTPPGPMDINLRLDETFFTFFLIPAWGEIMSRPVAERAALFADPGRRERLVRQAHPLLTQFLRHAWIGETCSAANRGLSGRRLAEIAEERGASAAETLIEIALADDLHTEFPIRGAMHSEIGIRSQILAHPNILVGASDAGAHLSQFCGAGDSSYLLAEFVRSRKLFSLEEGVFRLTGQPARVFGVRERGHLEQGWVADLVVFDAERIDPGEAAFRRDLPGPASRYVREPRGIDHVMVAGEWTVRDGRYTEARPGRIV
jgi:N-acyl-D-aspartate/D-glutamate deacylase